MSKQIQSIERGLFILNSIIFNNSPITATEIAKQLGVHKSTISHLSSTLIQQGYLAREPGSWRLKAGPKVYRIARTVPLTGEELGLLEPFVDDLADTTRETAHIAELRGKHVMFLANRYPDRTLRVHTETGSLEAAHATAVGKALLAGLTDDEISSLYENTSMGRFTEKTITRLPALLKELENVRNAGFARDLGEMTPGIGCLAVPVRDRIGLIVAAVGISGPEERMFQSGIAHEKTVIKCAASMEKKIAR
jgi:IclR family transcriptional regulator, KDG regulon repressor